MPHRIQRSSNIAEERASSGWQCYQSGVRCTRARWRSARYRGYYRSTCCWHAGIAPAALAPHAATWLRDAEEEAALASSGGAYRDPLQRYSQLLSLLRHLHGVGEGDMRVWMEQFPDTHISTLEARLRQQAVAIWNVAKLDIARQSNKDTIRADLLRTPVADVSCGRVLSCYRESAKRPWVSQAHMLSHVISQVSGCLPDEANMLLKFAQNTSELFAPIEFAYTLGRQNWQRRPFALGVALLPLLEQALYDVQKDRASISEDVPVRVVVLGGHGITAAFAARLGCKVEIVEPCAGVRDLLVAIAEDNQLAISVIDRLPEDLHFDVLVWEDLDEDTIVENGSLETVRDVMRECQRLSLPIPKVVPARIQIAVAPVDEGLERVRNFDLSRFDRLRASEMALPHRWPRGASHIKPVLRADATIAWDIDLTSVASLSELDSADELLLAFTVESGARITGLAYWIDAPLGASCKATNVGQPEAAWVACVHQMPQRRVALAHSGVEKLTSKTLAVTAFRTSSRIWFKWIEDGTVGPVAPDISKTRLPQWQFKMLNDHERNCRYDSAVSRAVRAAGERNRCAGQDPRHTVVDCGCGAGLLSLIAARAGASLVHGIEISPIVGDITVETFSGYRHEASALAHDSKLGCPGDLKLSVSDVRTLAPASVGKHDVVICELMDGSGLGESLLSVLEHACQHFAKPDAQVVPCKLEIHVALAWLRVPECHGSLNFKACDPFYFSSSQGGAFAEGASNPPPEVLRVGVEMQPKVPTIHSDSYTSKNLNRLERGEAWDLLTQEMLVGSFDMTSALRGERLYPHESHVVLSAIKSGVANCVHWWWTAKLDNFDSISNRPIASGGGYETHWHQAFAPLGPLPLQVGDRLRIGLSIKDNVGQRIGFTVSPASSGSASAWTTTVPKLPQLNRSVNDLLHKWPDAMHPNAELSRTITQRQTGRGNVEGLAAVQRAALAIASYPALFRCSPHIRDRLLQGYYGTTNA